MLNYDTRKYVPKCTDHLVQFLEKVLSVTGNSSRFNSTPTDNLMKLSLGHELKGLLLNYALASRQRQEVSLAKDKMALIDQHLAQMEEKYTATKDKFSKELDGLKTDCNKKVEDLKKEHEGAVKRLKEDHAAELKKLEEVSTAKDAQITE
jgi:hypothetical protein